MLKEFRATLAATAIGSVVVACLKGFEYPLRPLRALEGSHACTKNLKEALKRSQDLVVALWVQGYPANLCTQLRPNSKI